MRGQRCFSGAENPSNTLCNRQPDGARPSRRVWCSRMGTPADGNADRTRCQRRTTLGLQHSGKKNWKKPLLGQVCLLTTGAFYVAALVKPFLLSSFPAVAMVLLKSRRFG